MLKSLRDLALDTRVHLVSNRPKGDIVADFEHRCGSGFFDSAWRSRPHICWRGEILVLRVFTFNLKLRVVAGFSGRVVEQAEGTVIDGRLTGGADGILDAFGGVVVGLLLLWVGLVGVWQLGQKGELMSFQSAVCGGLLAIGSLVLYFARLVLRDALEGARYVRGFLESVAKNAA